MVVQIRHVVSLLAALATTYLAALLGFRPSRRYEHGSTTTTTLRQRQGDDSGIWNDVDADVDGTAYCANLAAALPELTERIRLRPGEDGLRPITALTGAAATVSDDDGNAGPPPPPPEKLSLVLRGLDDELLSSAFRGKTITLFGDSTLRYLTTWLQVLLHDKCWVAGSGSSSTANATVRDDGRAEEPPDWSKMTLSEANAALRSKAQNCTPAVNLNSRTTPDIHAYPTSTTRVVWRGFSGKAGSRNEESIIEQGWNYTIAKVRPEILVVNMGLHWQHLMGKGRDVDGSAIRRWVNFETEFLQNAVDRAIMMGSVKVLLFKTENFICEGKWNGAYLRGHELYSNKNEDAAEFERTVQMCEQLTIKKLNRSKIELSAEQISRYCHHGTFNEYGATYLNKRMFRFVTELLSTKGQENDQQLPFKVGIFDDHDVESCEYTNKGDGRHYKILNLPRIRLLGNILSCAASETTTAAAFNEQMRQYAAGLLATTGAAPH